MHCSKTSKRPFDFIPGLICLLSAELIWGWFEAVLGGPGEGQAARQPGPFEGIIGNIGIPEIPLKGISGVQAKARGWAKRARGDQP